MKTITPYLLKFVITASILTFGFRAFLSYALENEVNDLVFLASSVYGALMFVFGWYFGKKDSEYLPIFDIGFRFHISTYLVHNVISFLWVGVGFGSQNESISVLSYIAVYWGIFLLIHFVFFLKTRKRTINSLDKDNIFE